MVRRSSPPAQYIVALAIMTLLNLGLFGYEAWHYRSLETSYLPWNLFLAWLPLLFAIRLARVTSRKLWSSWEGMALSLLWLAFLPNSFYLVSDLIHLQEVSPDRVLYDAVMFAAFLSTGLMLGFSSLYLVHQRLRRRFGDRQAAFWVGVTLLFCSIAIYLGRDLRWNSWDILFNPAGLLFDVSDRVRHLAAYPHMILVVTSFFVLLAGFYNLLWRATRLFVPRQ